MGSKCKVFKYILIINSYQTPEEAFDIANTISQNVKKTIISGKQGEAALKFFNDGTFICPLDTIADNLKIVEEAIKKSPYEDRVGIGMSWMADNFYSTDQKKYELENPKQLFDTDQLIDYYYKLCIDRPLIQYIEDPIYSEDVDGWSKILTKFGDNKVKIGSRKLYTTLSDAKNLVEKLTADSHPDLAPEVREAKNAKRIRLFAHLHKPYEYPTLTKFLDVVKYYSQIKTAVFIGENFSDTQDTTIIDLAFSINNAYICLSSPSKFEKMIKYSRYMEILKLEQLKYSK